MEIVLANCWKEVFDYYVSRRSQVIRGFVNILVHLIKCFDTVFQTAYRYISIALKVFFPCPIAIKFSPMIDYRLKFVKM